MDCLAAFLHSRMCQECQLYRSLIPLVARYDKGSPWLRLRIFIMSPLLCFLEPCYISSLSPCSRSNGFVFNISPIYRPSSPSPIPNSSRYQPHLLCSNCLQPRGSNQLISPSSTKTKTVCPLSRIDHDVLYQPIHLQWMQLRYRNANPEETFYPHSRCTSVRLQW